MWFYDQTTLTYLGYTAAALAALGVSYYYTKKGAAVIGLKPEDLQLIGKGALTGALHSQGLESIISCIEDPMTTIKEFEDAISKLDMNDKSSTLSGLYQLAMALGNVTVAVDKCDKDVTTREIEIFNHMLSQFSDPK